MALNRFETGKILTAYQLNEIVDAIENLIVAGPGITVQRLGRQIIVSATNNRPVAASTGGASVVEAEITSLSPFRATWHNGAGDQTITLSGSADGYTVGDQVVAAHVRDADDGALKWAIVGGNDFGVPVTVSNTNAEGSAATYARSDHTHNVVPRYQ